MTSSGSELSHFWFQTQTENPIFKLKAWKLKIFNRTRTRISKSLAHGLAQLKIT